MVGPGAGSVANELMGLIYCGVEDANGRYAGSCFMLHSKDQRQKHAFPLLQYAMYVLIIHAPRTLKCGRLRAQVGADCPALESEKCGMQNGLTIKTRARPGILAILLTA